METNKGEPAEACHDPFDGNHGFNDVLKDKDGSVIVVMQPRTLRQDGSMILALDGAARQMVLSDKWVSAVLERLDPDAPALQAIKGAIKDHKLVKTVTAVDRRSGELLMWRVR